MDRSNVRCQFKGGSDDKPLRNAVGLELVPSTRGSG